MKEQTLRRSVSFLDADGKRAIIDAEITMRNGYPEFTASADYLGSHGQCLDEIKPATHSQRLLIGLWKDYHLTNIEKLPANVKFWPDFTGHLTGILDEIEKQEKERQATKPKTQGDERLKELMDEQGIDETQTDAARAYLKVMGADDLADFQEAYNGEYSSDEEFAREQADQMGALENIENNATWPHNHIDWTAAAADLMQDYTEQDGYYFRNL